MDTLRLLYPQWQGGDIAHWFSDLSVREAAQGYYLGAQILNLLAPASPHPTLEVPISLDYTRGGLKSGVNMSEASTEGKANRLNEASEASTGLSNPHTPNINNEAMGQNTLNTNNRASTECAPNTQPSPTSNNPAQSPLDFDIIKAQTKAALSLLSIYEPRRI